MRAGKNIQWDDARLRVISLPEVKKLVHSECRRGWLRAVNEKQSPVNERQK